jgi:hypothetical protein
MTEYGEPRVAQSSPTTTHELAWPRPVEDTGLTIIRAPEMVLEEAREAARALKGVIDAKPKKVLFGGEPYLEYEDWQTVGRFYGIAPRIVSSAYVTYGKASGWEATAQAVHVTSGRIVSSADAMCMDDEEKWRARPAYEWHYVKRSGGTSAEDPGKDELIWEKGKDGKSRPRKERVSLGDVPVPTYQLRSMAQTRAAAKALRNALAWVVVLAGYKPTPAEELPAHDATAPIPAASVSVTPVPSEEVFPTVTGGMGIPMPIPLPADPVSIERERLLEEIRTHSKRLRLAPEERRELWLAHCGAVQPREAPMDALKRLALTMRELKGALDGGG